MSVAQWKQLVDHVQQVPEQVYEGWNSRDGWDNHTQFGKEYGEDGFPWCVMFDWDMYADMHLQAVVPKVDNVSAFSSWARQHGQWSEYPSIGAWVNFDSGAHTEIVTGFDGTNVRTKGGNSIKAGAEDRSQGNGVWSHTTARRSSRIVGYLAPRFPDAICPPTADPHDYRGGKAVTEYVWVPTAAPPPAFPGRAMFGPGANNIYVTQLGRQLVARGFGHHYTSGPGPRWSDADQQNVRDFQLSRAALRGAADGLPGPVTWALLFS